MIKKNLKQQKNQNDYGSKNGQGTIFNKELFDMTFNGRILELQLELEFVKGKLNGNKSESQAIQKEIDRIQNFRINNKVDFSDLHYLNTKEFELKLDLASVNGMVYKRELESKVLNEEIKYQKNLNFKIT